VSNGNMGMSDPAILLVDVLRILRTRKPRSKGEACAINAVYIYCFGYTKDVAPLRVTALEFRAWLKNGHAQRDIRNLGVYGVAIWEALLDEVMPELDKTTRETLGQHYDMGMSEETGNPAITIRLKLSWAELDALRIVAARELRDPPQQALHIIRQALIRLENVTGRPDATTEE